MPEPIKNPKELLEILKEENQKILSNCEDLENIPQIVLNTDSSRKIILTYEKDKRFPEIINPAYYIQTNDAKPINIKEAKLLSNLEQHFEYISSNYEKDIAFSLEGKKETEEKNPEEKETEEKKSEEKKPEEKKSEDKKQEKKEPELKKMSEKEIDKILGNKNKIKELETQDLYKYIENAEPSFLKKEHLYNIIDYRIEGFNKIPNNLRTEDVCDYMLDSIYRNKFLENVINKNELKHDGRSDPLRAAHIIKKLIDNIPKAVKESESIKKKINDIMTKFNIEKILKEEQMAKEIKKETKKEEQPKKTDKINSNENQKKEKPQEHSEKDNLSVPMKKESIFRRIIRFIKELIENIRYNRVVKYNDNIPFEKEYERLQQKAEKKSAKAEKEKLIEEKKQEKIEQIEKLKKDILTNEKSSYNQIMKLSQLAVGKNATLVIPLNNGYMKMTPTGSTVRIEVGKNEVKETPTGGYAAKFRETDLITFKSLGRFPKTDLVDTLSAITNAGGIKSPEIEIKVPEQVHEEEYVQNENNSPKPEQKEDEKVIKSTDVKNYPFYELAKRDVPELGNDTIDKAIELFNKKQIKGKNNDIVYKLPEGKAVVITPTQKGPVFYIQDKKNSEKFPLTKESYKEKIQPLLEKPAPLLEQKILNKDTVEYLMEKMIAESKTLSEKDKKEAINKRGNIKSEIFRDKEEDRFIILSTYENDKGETSVKGIYKSIAEDVNFNINMPDVETKGEDAILENKEDLLNRISQYEYEIVNDMSKKEEYAQAFDIPMEELKSITEEINCAANTIERDDIENDIQKEPEFDTEEKDIGKEQMEEDYDDRYFETEL